MFLKVLLAVFLFGAPSADHYLRETLNTQKMIRLVDQAIQISQDQNGGIDPKAPSGLSRKLVKTAQCFDLDPMVFAALIWRESHFQQSSQSETGAVGLTQLTKPGIREVLERLSSGSPRVRSDLRNQLLSCFPQIAKKIPEQSEWENLTEWKRKISHSPELALVFGAVLLKVKLTSDYRNALEKYNGDPRIKIRFAREVLTLANWISSSFMSLPSDALESSKFLASIQGFSPDPTN